MFFHKCCRDIWAPKNFIEYEYTKKGISLHVGMCVSVSKNFDIEKKFWYQFRKKLVSKNCKDIVEYENTKKKDIWAPPCGFQRVLACALCVSN